MLMTVPSFCCGLCPVSPTGISVVCPFFRSFWIITAAEIKWFILILLPYLLRFGLDLVTVVRVCPFFCWLWRLVSVVIFRLTSLITTVVPIHYGMKWVWLQIVEFNQVHYFDKRVLLDSVNNLLKLGLVFMSNNNSLLLLSFGLVC